MPSAEVLLFSSSETHMLSSLLASVSRLPWLETLHTLESLLVAWLAVVKAPRLWCARVA